MDKLEALQPALEQRTAEVNSYQINIDNFERMLARLEGDDDPDMLEFADELRERIKAERRQQKRAALVRDVIQDQVDEILGDGWVTPLPDPGTVQ